MVIELTSLEKVAIEYLGKLTTQLKDLKKEIDDDAHDFRMEMRDMHKGTNNKIEEIGRKVESMNNELIEVKTKVELYQTAENDAESRLWKRLKFMAKWGGMLLLAAFSFGAVFPSIAQKVSELLIYIKNLIK